MNATNAQDQDVNSICDHGRCLAAAGNTKKALRVFQLACVRHPLEGAPWVGLGFCQQKMGDAESAFVAFKMARSLGVDHPGIAVHEAECLLRLGERDEARTTLEHACQVAASQGDLQTLTVAQKHLKGIQAGS